MSMNNNDSEFTFNVLTMTRFGRMLVNKNDVYVGRSLIQYGEYSWEEIAVIGLLDLSNANVIEAGSNIGSHTIPLSQRISGSGRLYAFEPQRLIYQTLSANLALNQCDNVHAYWAGVGAKAGKILIPELSPRQAGNFGGVSANSREGESPMIEVPCMTIDSLRLESCALIKADVEGMELDVITGGEKTIRTCRPTLYLEADRREKLPPLIRKLKSLHYQLWWHVPNLFNPDNIFHEAKDIFNVHSINILGFPAEKEVPVSGLDPVKGENDWFC
ncbi:MAG: FkbM family methyltransferase [Gammaproteobacteria bacterium]|nr:FkbM family methyltransferase [Gammaproteobacteria bacterium]